MALANEKLVPTMSSAAMTAYKPNFTGLIPPRKPDSIRFANQPPELAPSSDDPLWDACALVQLIRPVIQREVTRILQRLWRRDRWVSSCLRQVGAWA